MHFARGTDLLLIEATLPRPERTGVRGHLTPAEAGDHGRRAGARRLVITHFSDELDAEWARAEADTAYGRPVELATTAPCTRCRGSTRTPRRRNEPRGCAPPRTPRPRHRHAQPAG